MDWQRKWQHTTDRLVGFIDIMGYKNIVATWPHEKIYPLMAGLSAIVDDYNRANDREGLTPFSSRSVFFSDSIVVFSVAPDMSGFLTVQFLASNIFDYLLKRGIACRGAITAGRITADFERSIFYGQALVEAYLLQEDLPIYAIAVDQQVLKLIREAPAKSAGGRVELFFDLRGCRMPCTAPCPVPTKSGRNDISLINWSVMMTSEDEIVKLLEPFNRPDDPKLQRYYSHTLTFALGEFHKFHASGLRSGVE